MKAQPMLRPIRYALLAILIILAACRSGSKPVTTPDSADSTERIPGKSGGVISVRAASPPQTFNYLKAADEASLIVAFYLMGGRLAEFDHDTGQYKPGIAENWKILADGRTIEITLRKDLKFSDGHPLNAQDVEFSFRALYDERTASPAFRDAMLIDGQPIKAMIVDQQHLRLIFPVAVAAPENYLSNLAVLPRHVLENDFNQGKFGDAYGLSADPQSVITAGAFTPESTVAGERITLKRNPHYWKKDAYGTPLPYLDKIVIEIIGDANNALARLKQGSLDICDRIRPGDYADLRAQSGPVRALDAGPGLATDHLWFNLNPAVEPAKLAWFSDARFRRAISHAIDRETLASITLQGLATPLYGFVSPGNRAWVANDLPRTNYDLEKSRALLIEAGFVVRGTASSPELFDSRNNRVELTLIVPVESQPRGQMAAVVQADLAKLGIRMQVAKIEFGDLTRRISQSFDYDAALLGTSISEPDPSSYANFLTSASAAHQWHPRQKKPATDWETRIDELVAAQSRESNAERRRSQFHDIQRIMAEQLPVIPIVSRHLAAASNRRVGNHRPSTMLPYSLWNAEELFVR